MRGSQSSKLLRERPHRAAGSRPRTEIHCAHLESEPNNSSRPTLPLGPSNSYFLSTASNGIRRRSAASASRERVKAFSFTRSCWCAASHSCCDTIGGVFIATCPFPCSRFLSLLLAILVLLCFLNHTPGQFGLKNSLNCRSTCCATGGRSSRAREPFLTCSSHVVGHTFFCLLRYNSVVVGH